MDVSGPITHFPLDRGQEMSVVGGEVEVNEGDVEFGEELEVALIDLAVRRPCGTDVPTERLQVPSREEQLPRHVQIVSMEDFGYNLRRVIADLRERTVNGFHECSTQR